MTEREKAQFELINNSLWVLIKPYVKNEKDYKAVMSDIFNIFIRDRGQKYTDNWWDSWRDIYECPEKYKYNQQISGFGAELADSFYEWIEYESKHKDATLNDYYRTIETAFLNEWGRLRNEET